MQTSNRTVRWSHTLDGSKYDQGVNTPVIADGIVYVRSNGLGTQALARGVPSFGFGLHALRASDGTPLWTYPTAITQPVAAGGVVYAGDSSGNVIALHTTDGAVIWKQPVAGAISAAWRMSLTLANGILYVAGGAAGPAGGEVIVQALRAPDGRLRWQCRLPGASVSQLGTPVFAA